MSILKAIYIFMAAMLLISCATVKEEDKNNHELKEKYYERFDKKW